MLDLILGGIGATILVAAGLSYLKPKQGEKMDLFQLFEQLKAYIAELQTKLVDAEIAIAEAKQAAYEQGFAAGVASVGNDKIYSQEELDQKVAEAVAALQLLVEEASAKIAVLEAKVVELEAGAGPMIEAAVAAFKADLLAKYEEKQVVESAAETGFADLLK